MGAKCLGVGAGRVASLAAARLRPPARIVPPFGAGRVPAQRNWRKLPARAVRVGLSCCPILNSPRWPRSLSGVGLEVTSAAVPPC